MREGEIEREIQFVGVIVLNFSNSLESGRYDRARWFKLVQIREV